MSRLVHWLMGLGQPASPALDVSTTPAAIRDRIIDVISGLTPTTVSGDLFRPFRNERDGAFQRWTLANAAACRRRFQVRRIGGTDSAEISNSDFEELRCTFRIMVAYPQTHRDGEDAALDRDDAIDADMKQIDQAIGMNGRANLAPPYPDACWREEGNGETSGIVDETIELEGVDIAVMFVSYSYRCDRVA